MRLAIRILGIVASLCQGLGGSAAEVPHLGTGTAALHRGVYEVVLAVAPPEHPSTDDDLHVTFVRPDGSEVTVDGFHDGGNTFRARAYCDRQGTWGWTSASHNPGLDGRSGSFEVVASELKGKLRRHPDDPRQFARDDGDWFLHIGDTGYRYATDTEPKWRAYIDQAALMGATKIRVWFCRSRGGVEALFTADRRGLNLPYWQEIDRRIVYALEHHPDVILQLIPFGEDTVEIQRYGRGEAGSRAMARAAQARFSAFPNIHWCATNDRVMQDPALRDAVLKISADMAAREAWGTLLTNHQVRFSGYAFAGEPWSDIITLQDVDQVTGARILEYRGTAAVPVVHDEDRYELHKPPAHARYFFRRLMWASLLSGGHPTYGGGNTHEPYQKDSRACGVQGYYDLCQAGVLRGGAHDFNRIHRFFRDYRLTLVGMTPADDLVGGDPRRVKCIRGPQTIVAYVANPTGTVPAQDDENDTVPQATVRLPEGTWRATWFDPREGGQGAAAGPELTGGREATLRAPGEGDWILLLRQP